MTSTANPFNNGIVSDAWARPMVDVVSIYKDVSDLCVELLAEVQQHRKRRSLLIHGAAGSGKTHLLSRLRSTVMADSGGASPFFGYVRLATSPRRLPPGRRSRHGSWF